MVNTKTRMAFGLVLIVALLAAHTATAARTIDAGENSESDTLLLLSDDGRAEGSSLVAQPIFCSIGAHLLHSQHHSVLYYQQKLLLSWPGDLGHLRLWPSPADGVVGLCSCGSEWLGKSCCASLLDVLQQHYYQCIM